MSILLGQLGLISSFAICTRRAIAALAERAILPFLQQRKHRVFVPSSLPTVRQKEPNQNPCKATPVPPFSLASSQRSGLAVERPDMQDILDRAVSSSEMHV